jgi:hypothetical protein
MTLRVGGMGRIGERPVDLLLWVGSGLREGLSRDELVDGRKLTSIDGFL